LANDPAVEERERKSDNGIFFAGTTCDIPIKGVNSGSELDIVADVVFYADATFETPATTHFKWMLAGRRGSLMKKVNEIIRSRMFLIEERSAVSHPSVLMLI
jgi:hypothetical protein